MANYVDNQKLLEALTARREVVQACLANGTEKPPMSNYIGECILKIATHLAYKPNFYGYSYRDEMISDAIENCIQYIDNFNPEISKNAFSYITQICWYAFIRRIGKEKKQSQIKGALLREVPFELFELQGHDETGEFSSHMIDMIQMNAGFAAPEPSAPKTSRKKKGDDQNLEGFFE